MVFLCYLLKSGNVVCRRPSEVENPFLQVLQNEIQLEKNSFLKLRNLTRNQILSVQGSIQSIDFNRELHPCHREAYSSWRKVIILYLILQIFYYKGNFRFIQLLCFFCHLGNYHTFMNLAWLHQQNQKHEISVPSINVQYYCFIAFHLIIHMQYLLLDLDCNFYVIFRGRANMIWEKVMVEFQNFSLQYCCASILLCSAKEQSILATTEPSRIYDTCNLLHSK